MKNNCNKSLYYTHTILVSASCTWCAISCHLRFRSFPQLIIVSRPDHFQLLLPFSRKKCRNPMAEFIRFQSVYYYHYNTFDIIVMNLTINVLKPHKVSFTKVSSQNQLFSVRSSCSLKKQTKFLSSSQDGSLSPDFLSHNIHAIT